MNRLSVRSELPAFLLFLALIVGLLQASGNLGGTGPRIVDDNQIFKLQTEFSQVGVLGALERDIRTRFEDYSRMVPLYSVQKILEAKVFGTNIVAWRLYSSFVGILSAFFLYLFSRVLAFSPVESMAFSFLTLWGPQSLIFWKLLQGEGLGMLLLSASLLAMGLGTRCASRFGSRAYATAHVLLAIGASLSKESFVLMLPAVALCRIWLIGQRDKAGLKSAIRASLAGSVVLATAFVAELIVLKYGLSSVDFGYAGWSGFNVVWIILALAQFGAFSALCVALVLAAVVADKWVFGTKFIDVVRRARKAGILLPLGILLAVLVPQVLLYSKSSFVPTVSEHVDPERYLLPAMLAVSGFALMTFRLIRPVRGDETGERSGERNGINRRLSRRRILALLLVIFVCVNGWGVFGRATAFATYTDALDTWFESIQSHTNESDRIVVVFNSFPAAVRLKFILEEYLGRRNILYMIQPSIMPFERYKVFCASDPVACDLRTDQVAHMVSMRGVDYVADVKGAAAFLFPSHPRDDPARNVAERSFLMDRVRAAALQGYERFDDGLGHVSYYRKN